MGRSCRTSSSSVKESQASAGRCDGVSSPQSRQAPVTEAVGQVARHVVDQFCVSTPRTWPTTATPPNASSEKKPRYTPTALVTVENAAKLPRVHRDTVKRMIRTSRLTPRASRTASSPGLSGSTRCHLAAYARDPPHSVQTERHGKPRRGATNSIGCRCLRRRSWQASRRDKRASPQGSAVGGEGRD